MKNQKIKIIIDALDHAFEEACSDNTNQAVDEIDAPVIVADEINKILID